jgi:Haem-degrading
MNVFCTFAVAFDGNRTFWSKHQKAEVTITSANTRVRRRVVNPTDPEGSPWPAATNLPHSSSILSKWLLNGIGKQHRGSFPLSVTGTGAVGCVAVSGLPQREDYEFVVEAIRNLLPAQDVCIKEVIEILSGAPNDFATGIARASSLASSR